MGLLMNHLAVDGRGRVVFDAGDAIVEEEEEELAEDEPVDLSKLRCGFSLDLTYYQTHRSAFIPSPDRAAELTISDTLSSFRFSSDPNAMPDFSSLLGLKDTWDDAPASEVPYDGANGGEGPVDFFGNEDFDTNMGLAGSYDDGVSNAGDDFDGETPLAGPSTGLSMAAAGETGPFDPRRGGELVMSLVDGDDAGMFDYFDKGSNKAWAGAQHWKLRKVARKGLSTVVFWGLS